MFLAAKDLLDELPPDDVARFMKAFGQAVANAAEKPSQTLFAEFERDVYHVLADSYYDKFLASDYHKAMVANVGEELVSKARFTFKDYLRVRGWLTAD